MEGLEEKLADIMQPVDVEALRRERAEKTEKLVKTPGHPLFTLDGENRELEKIIGKIREQLDGREKGAVSRELLQKISELAIHYAKKGDLLYPLLKVKYKISGPSDVMWTTDDEIRDDFAYLVKAKEQNEEWKQRMEHTLARAEEMIYKETHILFPNCAVHFTEEEWIGIYQDAKDYADCLSVKPQPWEMAEQDTLKKPDRRSDSAKEVVLAGGHMTAAELEAVLNTIPMEITFVDAEDKNRYFNEGHKVFKRPAMALDREVFSCHPPKVEQKVRRIIEEFRAGTMDEVPVFMNKNGRAMLVKYMAVRDRNGRYMGTLELVQDMEFAREYFAGRHD